MELSLRKTKIKKLDFIFSSCPNKEKEDLYVAYQFVKELFCKVCKRMLLYGDNKYNIVDYPFLYRERQLDSVVLPVISELCHGFVLAEYPVLRDSELKGYEKENSKGRIDYWCIYKDYSFVIEMKHSYDAFMTDTTKDTSLIQRWKTMNVGQLQDIRKEVKHFEERTKGLIRLGLHFITPYCDKARSMNDVDCFVKKQKDILERLYNDVSSSKPKITTPSFMASWALPRNEKYFEIFYKGTYPGLLLLGKFFPSIQHDGCVK